MNYNFDEIIDRKSSDCVKYDVIDNVFGSVDLLPMWVADMDFRTPDFILEQLRKRLEHPILGYFVRRNEFFESVMQWMEKRHGWKIEKEWINFSPGIVSGLALIVLAFTEKHDRIIIQPPVYQPFFSVVEEQKRTLVTNPLKIENERYVMDYEDLEDKLKMGAKLLILSNPHNPVGRSWSKPELTKLADLCLQYHCLIVSDEIHSDLMMPGITHIPMATIDKKIANITITCMSPSKTFNLAGMSTSEIIISNEDLRDRFENQVNTRLHLQNGNLFGDLALEAAYTYGETWLEALKLYLANNSACVANALKNNFPEIKLYQNEATYLLWMDFSELGFSHKELYHKLIFDCKLGFNDGLLFGKEGKGFMRMNVACPKQKVEEAMFLLQNLKK